MSKSGGKSMGKSGGKSVGKSGGKSGSKSRAKSIGKSMSKSAGKYMKSLTKKIYDQVYLDTDGVIREIKKKQFDILKNFGRLFIVS